MRRIAKGEAGVQTRPSEAAVIDSQSPSHEKSRFIVAPYPNEEEQSRAGQGRARAKGRAEAEQCETRRAAEPGWARAYLRD
jgi:hypothetical protein